MSRSGVLYVIGDSNSRGVAPFLLDERSSGGPRVDVSLSERGLTTEQVRARVLARSSLAEGVAAVVFSGMNDSHLSARGIADGVRALASSVRRRLPPSAPVFVVPLFGVGGDDSSVVRDRRAAASSLRDAYEGGVVEEGEGGEGGIVEFVDPHVSWKGSAGGRLKAAYRTTKGGGSDAVDPLHMNDRGYREVAAAVSDRVGLLVSDPKRDRRVTAKYVAAPAPSPRELWREYRLRTDPSYSSPAPTSPSRKGRRGRGARKRTKKSEPRHPSSSSSRRHHRPSKQDVRDDDTRNSQISGRFRGRRTFLSSRAAPSPSSLRRT